MSEKIRSKSFNNKKQNKRNSNTPAKPHRKKVSPAGCPLYKKCGGCQLQNMTYDEQLYWKQGRVIALLGKYHRVSPIIGMEKPYHYRNKVQAAFGTDSHGRIISGVYQSSTHKIVPVDSCMIEDKKADEIIVTIRRLLKEFRIMPYNERNGKGFLRHVLVKRGFATNEIMVVLVGSTQIFPHKKHFVDALLNEHPEITTIILNVNPHFTSLVLGEREEVLYGKGTIEDVLCGCKFRISARSFYQINPVQTEKLYNTAIEFAGLTGTETVLDAYCGIGTIGMVAAKHAGNVIGVEVNSDAVKDAIYNAKNNEIKNIRFYCDDAGKFMTELARDNQSVDVVFMDPPRAGSDIPFLKSVIKLAPKRVVYISCNPETQARDLRTLVNAGYKVRKIQPVDMFPHTNHVECICALEKR